MNVRQSALFLIALLSFDYASATFFRSLPRKRYRFGGGIAGGYRSRGGGYEVGYSDGRGYDDELSSGRRGNGLRYRADSSGDAGGYSYGSGYAGGYSDGSGDNDSGDNESGDNDSGDNESGDNDSGDNDSGDNDSGDNDSGDNESGDNEKMRSGRTEYKAGGKYSAGSSGDAGDDAGGNSGGSGNNDRRRSGRTEYKAGGKYRSGSSGYAGDNSGGNSGGSGDNDSGAGGYSGGSNSNNNGRNRNRCQCNDELRDRFDRRVDRVKSRLGGNVALRDQSLEHYQMSRGRVSGLSNFRRQGNYRCSLRGDYVFIYVRFEFFELTVSYFLSIIQDTLTFFLGGIGTILGDIFGAAVNFPLRFFLPKLYADVVLGGEFGGQFSVQNVFLHSFYNQFTIEGDRYNSADVRYQMAPCLYSAFQYLFRIQISRYFEAEFKGATVERRYFTTGQQSYRYETYSESS